MKRFTTFVCGLSFLICLTGVAAFAQTKQAPRPDNRQDRRTDRQDRQTDRGPSVEDRVDRRVDRTEKRTDRLERKDTRVERRETNEKNDRAARDARAENLETRIERNEKLRSRVQNLLPAGTNLSTAANGFKNEGQFIAALHASKNVGVPFADLKARMTGSNPMSLGQSIQALKPSANGNSEASKAEKQATETMK